MPIRDRNQKREQGAIPAGMHGRAASLRVSQSRVSGRLQPRPRETLETFLARRRVVGRPGPQIRSLVEKRFRVCKIGNRRNRLRSLQAGCTS